MKRLWLSGTFLAVLLAASLWNAHRVEQVTDSITELLNQAEELALSEEWEQVDVLTRQAYDLWMEEEPYFSVMLVYGYVDEVSTGFEEVMGFLQYRAGAEYDSANGTLVAKVEHLAEVEAVNWRNVL